MDDKIRYSLADRSGELRFEDFDIADAPQFASTAEAVRAHLVGRPLREVTPASVAPALDGAPPECRRAVLRAVREAREMFGHA